MRRCHSIIVPAKCQAGTENHPLRADSQLLIFRCLLLFPLPALSSPPVRTHIFEARETIGKPRSTRPGTGAASEGVVLLRTDIDARVCDLAVYIIEHRATVRTAAKQFGVSKSTVHKDLTERLPRLDPGLYRQVRALLDLNKAERHIRGGLATRRKYKGE